MLRLSSIYFKTTPAVMVMAAKMMPLLSAAERSEVDAMRHYTPLTARYLLLATHYSLRHSLLTTHYSLLSLLATHYSLLTTRYSLLSLLTAAPHFLLGRGPDQQLRGIGPGSGAGLPDQRGAVHLPYYALRTAYFSLTTNSSYCSPGGTYFALLLDALLLETRCQCSLLRRGAPKGSSPGT